MTALYVCENDAFREASAELVLSEAQSLLRHKFRRGAPLLENPQRMREFLLLRMASYEHEVFGIIYLNSRHRLIAIDELFRGTLHAAQVYVREVVKATLAHNASSVVLFHNHPSGDCEPSLADEEITDRLADALSLIDVNVIDHLIVGAQVYSFAEAGLL